VTSSILLLSENGPRVGLEEKMAAGGIFVPRGHKLVTSDSEMKGRNGLEEERCKEVDDLHVML
jgi:hypothetical protein